ncbi:MAG: ATP-binding cassette domain-containing protein [Desulfocucumaceae bacterium]
MPNMSFVRLENVWHTYFRGTPLEAAALSGFNLDIYKGEFVALVGPAGSGKSTVLQHLNGVLLPDRGRVLVDRWDTRDKKARKRMWALVGLVMQYPERQFFEETVYREIAFGPRNAGLTESAVNNRVLEALDMVGISDESILDKSPYALSGGEQRRVALASVLAIGTKVLALDEPTAGIDSGGRKKIYQALTRLKAERGVTIVMAIHSMDDVSALADRIAILQEGKIALDGTARQIFKDEDMIKKAGLELPFSCKVAAMLNKKGFGIQDLPLTIDEATNGVLKRLGVAGTQKNSK